MNLTDHEVSLATNVLSSAVAVAAIVWGYIGTRSANRNALEIARQERIFRREEELKATKRQVYGKALANLSELMSASILEHERQTPAAKKSSERWLSSLNEAILSVSEVEITSPKNLAYICTRAYGEIASEMPGDGALYISMLRIAMRMDLAGQHVPTMKELSTLN